MKRLALILALLCSLPACFSNDEEALRELTVKQVGLVQTELKGLDQSRVKLETRLDLLQSRLNSMDDELGRVDARLLAARSSNTYLMELHTVGFGQSPGSWVLENPAWPTNVLLLFALAVVLCWVLYRMRLRGDEAAAMAEVNRVIAQINSAPRPVPQPAAPAAPAPPPAKAPAPRPAARPVPKTEPKPAARVAEKSEKPEKAEKAEKTGKTEKATPEKASKPAAKRPVSRRDVRRKAAARPVAKKCKVAGCPNKHRSKGYCNKHYQQWRKSGSPEEDQED